MPSGFPHRAIAAAIHNLPECPKCKEGSGLPCRTTTGRIRDPHEERKLLHQTEVLVQSENFGENFFENLVCRLMKSDPSYSMMSWKLPVLDRYGKGLLSGEAVITFLDAIKFCSKLKISDSCLNYTGLINSKHTYGVFHLQSSQYRIQSAHRVAYVLAGNKITQAKPYVLHKCDNVVCCNPDHLWCGEHEENQKDKAKKYRGVKSKLGLPFGVKASGNGRYQSASRCNGKLQYNGSYDSWAVASAVASYYKNLSLNGE